MCYDARRLPQASSASSPVSSIARNVAHLSASWLVNTAAVPIVPAVHADMGGDVSRIQGAAVELEVLDRDFDAVVRSRGGDGVRARLGTVYKPPVCEPRLCSFPSFMEKFVRSNAENLDNIDALDEPLRKLLEAYTQADFYSYSSNFADFGNGGGLYGSSPQSDAYLDKARAQVKIALTEIRSVIKLISTTI
jgi:hypothetical protein